MLGACCIGCDVRQVNVGLLTRRQLDFGFFGCFLQALHRKWIALKVHALLCLETLGQEVDQTHVKVFATQEGVAVCCQHFKLLFTIDVRDLYDRDVECTATQVIYRDGFIALGFVHAVGQRGCGGFVDDALYIQPCNAAGVFGCLTLCIVKVSRDGNDRFFDFATQIVLGRLLHFFENFSRYLWGRHFLALGFHPGVAIVCCDNAVGHHADVFLDDLVLEATTNQTLNGEQGVLRVGDRLTLGALANQRFVIGVCNDRWRCAIALAIFDDLGLIAIQNR